MTMEKNETAGRKATWRGQFKKKKEATLAKRDAASEAG